VAFGVPLMGQKVKDIKCPTCRLKTSRREIVYVTNGEKKKTKEEGHQLLGGAGVGLQPDSASASTEAEFAAIAAAVRDRSLPHDRSLVKAARHCV
jgi:hypothetical protein